MIKHPKLAILTLKAHLGAFRASAPPFERSGDLSDTFHWRSAVARRRAGETSALGLARATAKRKGSAVWAGKGARQEMLVRRDRRMAKGSGGLRRGVRRNAQKRARGCGAPALGMSWIVHALGSRVLQDDGYERCEKRGGR